jgi:hypothetical protein
MRLLASTFAAAVLIGGSAALALAANSPGPRGAAITQAAPQVHACRGIDRGVHDRPFGVC